MAAFDVGAFLNSVAGSGAGYLEGQNQHAERQKQERADQDARARQRRMDHQGRMTDALRRAVLQAELERANQGSTPRPFRVNAHGVSTDVATEEEAERILNTFGLPPRNDPNPFTPFTARNPSGVTGRFTNPDEANAFAGEGAQGSDRDDRHRADIADVTNQLGANREEGKDVRAAKRTGQSSNAFDRPDFTDIGQAALLRIVERNKAIRNLQQLYPEATREELDAMLEQQLAGGG